MLRPCLGVDGEPCGELTASRRCPTHTRAQESRRPSRRVRGRYDARWMRLRAIAIRNQPWCSRCKQPPSPSNPLTGDHILPMERGGRNVIGNVQVLCRACNSAKRDRLETRG